MSDELFTNRSYLEMTLTLAKNHAALQNLENWTKAQDERNKRLDEELRNINQLAGAIGTLQEAQALQAQRLDLLQAQQQETRQDVAELRRTRRTWLDTAVTVVLLVAVLVLVVLLAGGQLQVVR